mmetsp:Transcript_3138/g.9749  ORF Transcript_3138/g.9749 Transcript_3138/m.9749 type:complete len:203 (-) Transcript_3138:111-719(-)
MIVRPRASVMPSRGPSSTSGLSEMRWTSVAPSLAPAPPHAELIPRQNGADTSTHVRSTMPPSTYLTPPTATGWNMAGTAHEARIAGTSGPAESTAAVDAAPARSARATPTASGVRRSSKRSGRTASRTSPSLDAEKRPRQGRSVGRHSASGLRAETSAAISSTPMPAASIEPTIAPLDVPTIAPSLPRSSSPAASRARSTPT